MHSQLNARTDGDDDDDGWVTAIKPAVQTEEFGEENGNSLLIDPHSFIMLSTATTTPSSYVNKYRGVCPCPIKLADRKTSAVRSNV